ncbi:MAG: hypothetical protein H6811_08210 [Phycisphaeraceae bacterium]|nr:hypothetical protein [Phycisphaeraceae bacterium]
MPNTRALAAALVWIIASAIGVPLGIWIILEARPEELFIKMTFPAAMFLTQSAAVAAFRRHRPWLIPLGISCLSIGSYLAFEKFRRDLDPMPAAVLFGAFAGVGWAASMSRRWLHVPAWFVVGTGAMVTGLILTKSMEHRYLAGLSLGAIIGGITAPVVWWTCRTPASPPPPAPGERTTPTRAQRLAGSIILRVVGALMLALAAAIFLGWSAKEPAPAPDDLDLFRPPPVNRYPGDALDLGDLNALLAVLCATVGIALLCKANWARYAIHLAAPAGALALASTHAQRFWTNDIPLTILLGLPFGVAVMLLGRDATILAATRRSDGASAPSTWIRRAVPWSLAVLAAAFIAYLVVQRNPPPRQRGLIQTLESRNTWVKHMAVTHVFMWHAIPGALGALIPPLRTRRAVAAST